MDDLLKNMCNISIFHVIQRDAIVFQFLQRNTWSFGQDVEEYATQICKSHFTFVMVPDVVHNIVFVGCDSHRVTFVNSLSCQRFYRKYVKL